MIMIITIPVRHRTGTRDLVALRTCAAKFLARQLHVVERNFFLSESCLRRQPKHPLDRSACDRRIRLKIFLGDQLCWISVRMANFAEVGHPRAIANAIRGIDRRARADQAPPAFRFRKVQIESPNRMSRPGFVIRNLRSWGVAGS